jgi:hypothetical protein
MALSQSPASNFSTKHTVDPHSQDMVQIQTLSSEGNREAFNCEAGLSTEACINLVLAFSQPPSVKQ